MKDPTPNRPSPMTARVAGVAFIALLTACSGKKEDAAAAPAAAPAAEATPAAATEATTAAAAPAAADASAAAPAAPATAMTPAALEELLAPIALYPDALLGPLLTAATHPQEVMDGGNYLLQTKLTGKELDADAEKAGFGPSTRALLQFPTVVDMMCQNFEWTQQLGSAMNTDQTAVLAAVQRLRAQAVDAGSLKSTPQQKVTTKTVEKQKVVVVEPAEPTVVYVPQYDPQAVYQPAATAAPAITTTTTTTTGSSGPSSGDVMAAGIFGFAAGLIVANIFDDDDDRYPYPYPRWGYGGMYYGGSAWYGGGYNYRPNYGYGGWGGGYRPGYGYRPPVNYPNAWNRPGSWTRPPVWTRPGVNNNNVFINVNNQNNYYNRFDGKKNQRVADTQRPQLVSPKVRNDVDRSYRPPSRPMPTGAVNAQGRAGGMQPGERRDDRADWKGQSGYQGARPGAAGAGGLAAGGKVPQSVPKISDRDVRDRLPASGPQRPAVADRPGAQARPAIADRPGAQQRPAVADRPGAQQRPAVGDRPGPQARPAIADRPGAQQRPAVADRPSAQQRPAMERPAMERPMPQQRPAMERPMPQQRPAVERPMPQQRPSVDRSGGGAAAPRQQQREGRPNRDR